MIIPSYEIARSVLHNTSRCMVYIFAIPLHIQNYIQTKSHRSPTQRCTILSHRPKLKTKNNVRVYQCITTTLYAMQQCCNAYQYPFPIYWTVNTLHKSIGKIWHYVERWPSWFTLIFNELIHLAYILFMIVMFIHCLSCLRVGRTFCAMHINQI